MELDSGQVTTFLNSYLEAWNRQAPNDLAGFYLPDGDLIAADGSHLKGLGAVAEYYRSAMSGPYGALRLLNIKLLSARQVRANLLLADASWEVHAPGQSSPAATPIGTFVVDTSKPTWRFTGVRIYIPMRIS